MSRLLAQLLLLRALLSSHLCHAFLVVPSSRSSSFTNWKPSLSHGFSYESFSSTSLSMSYKNVFVAGGSKGVGRLVIDKLLATGSTVKALVRSEVVVKELNALDGVTAVLGDAFEQKSVENAMDGCDAAITTLGGSTQDRRVDYEGNANVIESAGILGVQRVIMVSSVGCGNSKEAAPPSVFEVLKVSAVVARLLAAILHCNNFFSETVFTTRPLLLLLLLLIK
jgi:nucleoside-diphosphate-sugar epimerase